MRQARCRQPINGDVQIGAVRAASHRESDRGSIEIKADTVAISAGIRAEWSNAPISLVARPRILCWIPACRSCIGQSAGPALDGLVDRPQCAILGYHGESPVRVIRCGRGLEALQNKCTAPGPFIPCALQCSDRSCRLCALVGQTPDRRLAGPVIGLCIPSPVAGPYRLVRVAVRLHYLTQQDRAREVECALIHTAIVGPGVEPVRLRCHDIEVWPGACHVELFQESQVA